VFGQVPNSVRGSAEGVRHDVQLDEQGERWLDVQSHVVRDARKEAAKSVAHMHMQSIMAWARAATLNRGAIGLGDKPIDGDIKAWQVPSVRYRASVA
jgi:hypothetical protein